MAGASPVPGVGDLNNDGMADSVFDLSMSIVKDLLIDFSEANIGSGVDVGIFSFEADLDVDDPADGTFVTQLDSGLIGADLSSGADLSGMFDNATGFGNRGGNPALDTGVAVF